MKILYSAGNRSGAGLAMHRFLSRCPYEVKVSGYHSYHQFIDHIDWTLDAMYHQHTGCSRGKLVELFENKHLPMMGNDQAALLMEEVSSYNPDLVICDYEPIMSNIANSLGFNLWYSSPVHLLDGINWKNKKRYNGLLEVTRKIVSHLPKADRVFVNSPFALLGLETKPGYELLVPWSENWEIDNSGGGICLLGDSTRVSELSKILNCIPPYDLVLYSTHKYNLSHLESYLLSDDNYCRAVGGADWLFFGGESIFLMDGLINGARRFCISPDLSDPEGLLNAMLLVDNNLGDDIGQVEYLEYLSVDALEGSYTNKEGRQYSLTGGVSTLLDEVEKYAHSI